MKSKFLFQGLEVFQGDGLTWSINTNRVEMLWLLADYLDAEGFEWSSVTYSDGVSQGVYRNLPKVRS